MDLAIRAAVIFLFILVVTRLMGKRELASLEPFDLILLVVLGDLVQQGVTQDDYSVTGAMIVISVMVLMTVATSYLTFRSRGIRRFIEGQPVVLVENGRPIAQNLRRERITVEELEEKARLEQVDSLDNVRLAVLETSGDISIIPAQS
jgi:uncharacterized membrane protein YcaP (DUF421 family)